MQYSSLCTCKYIFGAPIDLMTLTDIILFILLVSKWCLNRTQSGPLGDPPLPPRYMYVSISLKKSLSLHVVQCYLYMELSFWCTDLLLDIDIYYFMLPSSERVVLGEHLIEVIGDPPPPKVHVCLVFVEMSMQDVDKFPNIYTIDRLIQSCTCI